MRTTTFESPPAGPTTTSSSLVGVLAQNGSASRLVIAISGGVPVSFTVPSMTACPAGGAAAAAGTVAVVAPGVTGAGAGAGGVSFWQAPAIVDTASAKMARPRLIMVVVLTGARQPVKRRNGWAGGSGSVRHPTGRGQQQIDPLGRGREVASDSQLAVDQDQVFAVEDLPEAGRVIGVAAGRSGLLLAHPDLETAHHRRLDGVGGAGQERPGDGVRAVARAVLGEARRGVPRRIDRDRDQMEVRTELARPAAHFGHLLAEQGAGLLAGGEDEIG